MCLPSVFVSASTCFDLCSPPCAFSEWLTLAAPMNVHVVPGGLSVGACPGFVQHSCAPERLITTVFAPSAFPWPWLQKEHLESVDGSRVHELRERGSVRFPARTAGRASLTNRSLDILLHLLRTSQSGKTCPVS